MLWLSRTGLFCTLLVVAVAIGTLLSSAGIFLEFILKLLSIECHLPWFLEMTLESIKWICCSLLVCSAAG